MPVKGFFFDSPNWRALRCSCGLALILCGQPLAWAVRGSLGYQGGAIFPAAPMVIGTLLLIRPGWLVGSNLKIPAVNVAAPVCLVLVPFAGLLLLSGDFEFAWISAYLALMALVTFCLAFNDDDAFRHFPFATLALGFIGSAAPLLQIALGGAKAAARLALAGNDNTLATAAVGGTTILASLIVATTTGRRSPWMGAAAGLAFVVGGIDVVLSFTRSEMLSVVLCLTLYVLVLRPRMSFLRRTTGTEWGVRFFGIVVAGAGALAPPILSAVFGDKMLDNILGWGIERINGAFDFVAGSKGLGDASSVEHADMVAYNWNGMSIWPHGAMAQSVSQGEGHYAHLSYLQSFYDLGIPGGTVFLLIALILPAALIVVRWAGRSLDPVDAFVILLFVDAQSWNLFHAVPYSWQVWLPTILVYVLLARRRPDPVGMRKAISAN